MAQRSSTDQAVAFAWTWQPSANAPTVDQLPACGQQSPLGGIHFVCGASVTVTVSPELAPSAQLTVWGFDAAGNRSPKTSLTFSTIDADPNQLYSVTHQWTTDQGGPVSPSSCGWPCIADTNSVSSSAPNGKAPVYIGPAGSFDGNGNSTTGFAGELNFADLSASPHNTDNSWAVYTPPASGSYFDWDRNFTVGAMLTPTAPAPSTGPRVALSQWADSWATLRLQINSQQHYELCVHSRTNAALGACATSPSTVTLNQSTYVSGEYDAINGEIRLYLNGTLAAVTNFSADATGDRDLIFLGSAKAGDAVIDRWIGQIANPMIAQAVFSPNQISQLRNEAFFPTAG